MRAAYATAPQTSSGSLKLAFGRTPQAFFRPADGVPPPTVSSLAPLRPLSADWQGRGGDKLSRATSFISADT